MLAVVLGAEVDAYIAGYAELADERGHRLVRRNGHAPARQVAAGVGQVEVVRPRVDDRRVDPATGQRQQFQSMILPRWARRSPKVAEVLPLLYCTGSAPATLSPRRPSCWARRRACRPRWSPGSPPSGRPNARPSGSATFKGGLCVLLGRRCALHHPPGRAGRLCCLVIVGVRADGRKELVAVADGTRESTDDWAELLRDLRRRGMRAPVVMVGDGALGLWRALREVFPATREQRCWQHVTRNVLGALPKSVHAGARKALNEIILAEDRTHAERAIDAFAADYGVKWPKAVAKVTGETERLLCFFDYPAEHWVHLRTTTRSRARSRRSGPDQGHQGAGHQGHRAGDGVQAARGRRGPLAGGQRPHLVALVRAGARFEAGKLIERPDETPDKEADEDVTKVAA